MNSGPTQRFVAGEGVGVTLVRGRTTRYNLEGFLFGFLLRLLLRCWLVFDGALDGPPLRYRSKLDLDIAEWFGLGYAQVQHDEGQQQQQVQQQARAHSVPVVAFHGSLFVVAGLWSMTTRRMTDD